TAFHIDFANSKKNGGKLLVINGFRFFRNKKRGHLQYWKCSNYYKERCPAIAIHDESTLILRLCHQHQHGESNDIEIKPLPSATLSATMKGNCVDDDDDDVEMEAEPGTEVVIEPNCSSEPPPLHFHRD
ncbi:uncharacterized protein Dwil_GK27181, partial [Drosophila willistoni]